MHVLTCFSYVQLFATGSSSVHGILQARILKWAAMPSSRGSSRPRDRTPNPSLLWLPHWRADSSPPALPGKSYLAHSRCSVHLWWTTEQWLSYIWWWYSDCEPAPQETQRMWLVHQPNPGSETSWKRWGLLGLWGRDISSRGQRSGAKGSNISCAPAVYQMLYTLYCISSSQESAKHWPLPHFRGDEIGMQGGDETHPRSCRKEGAQRD